MHDNQNEELNGRKGEWSRLARGNQMVTVAWEADHAGTAIVGAVTRGNAPVAVPFELSIKRTDLDVKTLKVADIDVTLKLTRAARPEPAEPAIALICNLPLTQSSFFNNTIGLWQAGQPGPDPVPDPASDPAPEQPYALEIDGPQHAVDLFPFVWLHPPGSRELANIARHYITLESCGLSADQLPLYQQLAGDTGSDAIAVKRETATSFLTNIFGPPPYVCALTFLPAPLDKFPVWRAALENLSGTLSKEELPLLALLFLGKPVDRFLADSDMLAGLANAWQALFALALVGTPSHDARLAAELTDVLRVWNFLRLLTKCCEGELREQNVRRTVLDARPVFPDQVAPFPPAPAISGPHGGSEAGSWEVLGVGTLKTARQRLLAYLPGELADVVNVMPRERQEVQARFAVSAEEQASGLGEQETRDNFTRQSLATNDLTNAVHEAMAADGVLRNLNNVEPAYNNLNLTLTGASADGHADSKWSGQDAARYMRQLTEQAARQLGERVSRQRGAAWHEFRERRQSNLIDNTGNGRLVGLYRWVDQLMQVHMEERGRRLVLSFLVAQPVNAWLSKVAGQGALPLQEPQPLKAFRVAAGQGYHQITEANYRGFGAQYGLCDMVPPPPKTVAVYASFDRAGAAEASGLCIPDGYTAVSGKVAIGLADSRYNLECSIAGQVYAGPGPTSMPVMLDTAVPAPSSNGTMIGGASVTLPATPIAAMISHTLKHIADAGGTVPVTVMTAAPAFVVQIDVECTRNDVGADQDYAAWQIRTYARLLRAYQEACSSYAKELGTRIEAASAGRTGEVQRNALRQACLDLLAPDGSVDPQQFRALAPLLSWDAMSWHYEPWQVGEAALPEVVRAETTEPSSERLFRQFLRAPSARVLVPVAPGSEEWLLFYLQFGDFWCGGPPIAPVSQSCMLLLEEIREPERLLVRTASGELERMPALLAPERPREWTVRVPTSMLYLQDGAALPRFDARAEAMQAEGSAK